MDDKRNHPFSGRAGSARRDAFAAILYAQQGGKCRMCHSPIPASLRGRSGKRAAVVDHLRPWRMVPERAYDKANLQLICRGCHATCESIEASHPNDPDMIAAVKEREGETW